MKLLYLDVNVIIDHVIQRQPWHIEADQLFELAHLGKVNLVTDAHTVVFVFHYLKKIEKDARVAKDKLLAMLKFVDVAYISKDSLVRALERDIPKDLEDAGQIEIALATGADFFISKEEGFKGVEIEIFTPKEFLTSSNY